MDAPSSPGGGEEIQKEGNTTATGVDKGPTGLQPAADPNGGWPSLALVYQEARASHDRQSRRIDAIDTKAGILVGFCSVVLVGIVGGLASLSRFQIACWGLVTIGYATVMIGIASAVGMFAYWVGDFQDVGAIDVLLSEYAHKPVEETQETIAAQLSETYRHNEGIIKRKIWLLKACYVLFLAGLALLVLVILAAMFNFSQGSVV